MLSERCAELRVQFKTQLGATTEKDKEAAKRELALLKGKVKLAMSNLAELKPYEAAAVGYAASAFVIPPSSEAASAPP